MKWFRHTHDRPRKILLLSKRWLAIPGALLCVCALCLVTTLPAYVTASAPQRQLPVYCVQRDYKVCSLTFDAAWGNEDTQELIDILDQYNVKATFFVVGDWVEKYPESVKALSDAGHEVMSHSNHHDHFNTLSAQEIIDDLNACNDKIEAITGTAPKFHRCPYGDYDNNAIRTIRSIGMEPIQWNVDSLDWKELTAPEITQRVMKNVIPGSIILFHNAAIHTPEALPGIIEALQKDGYTLCTVSELVYQGEYTIDNNGMQCPKGAEKDSK